MCVFLGKKSAVLVLLTVLLVAAVSVGGCGPGKPSDPYADLDPSMMKPTDMETELDFVIERLKTCHPVVKVSGFSAEQTAVIDAARAKMKAPLTKQDYYFELQRVFAAMGDGHTALGNPFQETKYLDLPLEWLIEDGLVVSADAGTLAKGEQVKSIGGRTQEELLEMLRQVVSHENDYWLFHCAPDYLTRGSFLSYFGLAKEDGTVEVEVLREGASAVHQLRLGSVRTLPRPSPVQAEWWVDPDGDLGYFRFDKFPAKEEMGPLEGELDSFFAAVKKAGVGNIAFDWRYNEGGVAPALGVILANLKTGPVYEEGDTPYPIPVKKPDNELYTGKVYVLTGKRTFSCAVYAATILHDNGITVTLGEPTGENPAFNRNSAEAAGELPVTGWRFMMAGHRPSRPNFLDASEEALFPEIEAYTSRAHLTAGRDAQIAKLREVTGGTAYAPQHDCIQQIIYNSRFNYFTVQFDEPLKSINASGIKIATQAGERVAVAGANIAPDEPACLIIATQRPLTEKDKCIIRLRANAFVLQSGETNSEPVELKNYKYE